MQDQYIILDKTFDQHATYTLIAWMSPIDTYVTRGEALAILQNGDTQMVVVAPCSGRMAATYFDPGARVLPRSIIGSIRPESSAEQQLGISGSLLIATGLILTALVVFPILAQLRTTLPVSTTDNTPNTESSATTDSPPSSDTNPLSPFESMQDLFPGGNRDDYPLPSEPATSDAPSEPLPTTPPENSDAPANAGDTSLLSDGLSNQDVTNDVLYYLDSIHTLNTQSRYLLETPVDISLFESDIMPIYDDLLRQQEELNLIADRYRNDPNLSGENATLLSFAPSWVEPCMIPFEQQRSYVYDGIAPDSDMQGYFIECDNIIDIVNEYTPDS